MRTREKHERSGKRMERQRERSGSRDERDYECYYNRERTIGASASLPNAASQVDPGQVELVPPARWQDRRAPGQAGMIQVAHLQAVLVLDR